MSYHTFESIKGMNIQLNEEDIYNLSNTCHFENIMLDSKFKSLIKYSQKIESLQCVNGIIVYNLLTEIKEDLRTNKPQSFGEPSIYTNAINIMSRMLSVLLFGHSFAHNWLWKAYIAVRAADSWPYLIFSNYTINFEQHENDIVNYLKLCQKNYYLPNIVDIRHPHFYKTLGISNVYDFIKSYYEDNSTYLTVPPDNVTNLSSIYFYNSAFHFDYLILADYFYRENTLFSLTEKLGIDWTELSYHLRTEKAKLLIDYRTIEWAQNPFKFIKYHDIIHKTVKINIYLNIWLQLSLFINAFEIVDIYCDNIDKIIRSTLSCLVTTFIDFLCSEDPLLWSIHFKLIQRNKKFNIRDFEELKPTLNKLKNEIINDINIIGINQQEILKVFKNSSRFQVFEKLDTLSIFNELDRLQALTDDIKNSWIPVLNDKDLADISHFAKTFLKNFILTFKFVGNFEKSLIILKFNFMNFYSNGALDLNTTFTPIKIKYHNI
ncbi:uncharacterized protein LOC126897242 isoform X2 [Daktulosphaira vitifoliae]|nr:uncharacterized protein LOC126897242 isoform X2 [Daktulosphaira vitifoliae]XP_050526663.1 uncharacterized protein LOC126897242 isoform X2 [Daktulosphaira vitifoliae]